MIVTETEDSPSKSLAVMKNAAVIDPVSKDDVEVVAENVRIASQECLLSSGDGGSVALERILHEKLDALSAEGLEEIVEVDPSGMLPLLEESNVWHRDNVEEVVERGERLRLGDMDCILLSQLVEGSSGANERLSSGEDVTALGGPPPKIVKFNSAGGNIINESTIRRACMCKMWTILSLVHPNLMARSAARQNLSP